MHTEKSTSELSVGILGLRVMENIILGLMGSSTAAWLPVFLKYTHFYILIKKEQQETAEFISETKCDQNI